MTLGLDFQQLASAAMDLLKNHWASAAKPLTDIALKKAGESLFTLLTSAFTGKEPTVTLKEPINPENAEVLELQIKHAIKANPQLAESISALIASIPVESRSRIVQTASQAGDKNVINQIAGDSNKISTKIS